MNLILFSLIGVLLALIGTGYYHEILKDVEWKKTHFEGLNGVAAVHIGHYKDVINVINNVTASAVQNQLISLSASVLPNAFGIFYDDPNLVADSTVWRSRGGLLIDETTIIQDSSAYQQLKLKQQSCLSAEFPLVSQLSIFIGLFKVYPALSSYQDRTKETHGAILEIYDYANKVIRYIALEKDSEDSVFTHTLI